MNLMIDVAEPDSNSIFITGDTYLQSDFWAEEPCSDEVKAIISESGLSLTNLEAPLQSGNPVKKYGSNLSVSENTIEKISRCGFDAVSLANNHIMDYGSQGLRQVIDACTAENVETFGAGEDQDTAFAPLIGEVNGQSVAIVGCCEFEESVATSHSSGATWSQSPKLFCHLEELSSQFDVTVLIAHGGLEYVPLPPSWWRNHLRTLSKTGIDAIVAHHPHTPQGWEIFKGTPIMYSLGNFLMYNHEWPSTSWSIGIQFVLDDGGISDVRMAFLTTSDGTVQKMNDEERTEYRKYIDASSSVIRNQGEFRSYWQEIACRLYYENTYRYQYHHRFKEYGVGHLLSFLYDPIRELDRVTKGIIGTKSRDRKRLALRDYTMTQSHRDAIQTALAIPTGVVEDAREKTPPSDIDWLFQYADGREKQPFTRRQVGRLRTLIDRIGH